MAADNLQSTKAKKNKVLFKKWTQEMEFFLIEEVREKQMIWDPRHLLYRNRTLRQYTFQEIANAIKCRFPQHTDNLTWGK